MKITPTPETITLTIKDYMFYFYLEIASAQDDRAQTWPQKHLTIDSTLSARVCGIAFSSDSTNQLKYTDAQISYNSVGYETTLIAQ